MTGLRIKIGIVFVVSFSAQTIASAEEPPALAHNPFARPLFDDIRPVRSTDGDSPQSFEDLRLRATLVSGERRLANVNGRVIRAGDELYGYTLLRVFENRAVFVNNGKQTTVYVKPNLEDDHDPRAENQDAD